MAITVPSMTDPQDLINSINSDLSPTELLKLQFDIGIVMMKYTAVSAIMKETTDMEKGIAEKM